MTRGFRSRFRALVIVQVLLLAATLGLLAWTAMETVMIAVPAVILIVVVLQLYALLRTVAAHVDAVEEFFAAINYEDFTRRFVAGDVDPELRDAFNRVIERFQQARAARETQASYLETIVRHLPVAFMAVRADGTLRQVNQPARRLTGLPRLTHIDDFRAVDEQLPEAMAAIRPGSRQLLQTRLRGVPAELRVSVAEIRQHGETERLYSMENLSGELTARESSAWRNLIRVLTHEIMNTLTPVTSLAQSSARMVDEPDAQADLRDALETIARRSEGLTAFVASYRELLKVPEPRPERIRVDDVLRGVLRLLESRLAAIDVRVDVHPASLAIDADPALLDQVLLNVIGNSIDVLQAVAKPSLTLTASLDLGNVLIRLHDNGGGVPDHLLQQVFVPFFTTKRGGSGIGLSLSRQIMTAHGGEITVANAGDGAVVTLRF